MNIFAIGFNPETIAYSMCDQHVIKMSLESAQMLSSALARYGAYAPYKPTHLKHPCTIWAGNNQSNYRWLFNHFMALNLEYEYRFGKVHQCEHLARFLCCAPEFMPNGPLEPFVLAMPEEFKNEPCPTLCYQAYYASKPFELRYTDREPPLFIRERNPQARIKIYTKF